MKSNLKRAQDKALKLAIEICFLRDNRECQVKKYFPEIKINHNGPLQADHCISRRSKHFFIDPRNLTCVCSTCNRAKGFGQKSIHRAIDDIVKMREGDFFNIMVSVDQTHRPNLLWKDITWVEAKIKELEKKLERLR